MGNHVSWGNEFLNLSNGGMSVFITILSLAAGRLARTDDERLLSVWLASLDQDVFGLGVVSFDLDDFGWNAVTLEQERSFLMRVIQAARSHLGWETLKYTPDEERVTHYLESFEALLEAYRPPTGEPRSREWRWNDVPSAPFEHCPKHTVFLHPAGCIVCHDEPLD